MEMKTKKNKMFLAMAVVAALAMVSVAGIVISDDADAAPSIPIGTNDQPVIVAGESAIELNFYASVWSALDASLSINLGYVYVLPGESVSGTISIGTVDAKGVFTATDTIKVTNAGGFRITLVSAMINGEQVAILAIGNVDDTEEEPTGTFELVKGKAVLGQLSPGQIDDIINIYYNPFDPLDFISFCDTTPFTGTLKAKDLELKASYIGGTIVSVEGDVATMGGLVNPYSPSATIDAELSVSGTAKLEYPDSIRAFLDGSSIMPDVFYSLAAVTIEKGADISIGNIEPMTAGSVTIATGGGFSYAYLIAADGEVISPDSWGASTATFDDVAVGEYTFIGYNATDGVFYGKYTVAGSTGSYTASLGINEIALNLIPVADITFGSAEIDFDPTKYANPFAFNLDEGEVGVIDPLTPGTAEFPINGISAGDYILFFGADISAVGSPISVFVGPSGTNMVSDVLVTISAGTPTASEIMTSAVTANSSIGYYYLDGDLTVKGTLKFLYTNSTLRGMMDNMAGHITLLDDGVIEYGVFPATNPIVPLADLGTIDAAYYYKNVMDGSAVKASTYYFTTIENALKNSDGQDIVVIGDHVIIVDTTWSAEKPTKIIFGNSTTPGTVKIGVYTGNPDDTKTAALDIGGNITIVKGNASSAFEVVSGQAIFNTDTDPVWPPNAHVKIVRASEHKIIYADVATAFNIVRSGETIELIQNADLRSDATLIAGAKFDDKGYTLTIPAGMTLTINGTYESTSPGGKLITERNTTTGGIGTFIVNSGTAKFPTGTSVENNGSIKVNTTGTFTLEGTMNGAGTGVLVIDGTFNATGAVNSISELELKGTLKIGTAIFQVIDLITVGAEPTLLTGDLRNNAVLTGKIDVAPTTLIMVYGTSTITKAGFNCGSPIQETRFVYQKDSTITYATQYSASGDLKYLPCDALLDYNFRGWYKTSTLTPLNEVTYADFAAGIPVGTYPVLYGDFVPKTFTVTLSDYNEGVNWVVNGVGQGASKVLTFNYGDKVKVSVNVLNGFSGTPVILRDGGAYSANTEFSVTANTVFTVSGVKVADPPKDDGGLTLIEILLIIIVIIIAIISIIVALRLLRS